MKKIFITSVLLFTVFFLFGCDKQQEVENDLRWLDDATGVKKCVYNNETVYYITSACCDKFNYLYTQEGDIICAPDGGFSGQGDGKCADFSLDAAECEVVK